MSNIKQRVEIKQKRDTVVEGFIQPAFATIVVRFEGEDGAQYWIDMDSESALNIMFQFEDGKDPVRLVDALRAGYKPLDYPVPERPKETLIPARRWWKFW